MTLVTYYNGNQIVRSGAGIRLYYKSHADCENHAACNVAEDFYPERCSADAERIKYPCKEIYDGSAAEHADQRSCFDIASVDEQKRDDNDKAHYDVHISVSQKREGPEAAEGSEYSLNQNIKRIGADIGKQEKSYAEMRNGKTEQQNDKS